MKYRCIQNYGNKTHTRLEYFEIAKKRIEDTLTKTDKQTEV